MRPFPNQFSSGLVKVASLKKRGEFDIVRPLWIFDNIAQSESDGDIPALLLPLEPRFVYSPSVTYTRVALIQIRHMFFIKEESKAIIQSSIDEHGDSFARDVSLDELREVRCTAMHHASQVLKYAKIFKEMPNKHEHKSSSGNSRTELAEYDHGLEELPGWMFKGLLLYADYQKLTISNGGTSVDKPKALKESGLRIKQALDRVRFAGADFTTDITTEDITHVLVENHTGQAKFLREKLSRYITFTPLNEVPL